MQGISGFNPGLPQAGQIGGQPVWGSQGNLNVPIGGGSVTTEEDKIV